MPTIDASRLESTATRIFEALGAPAGDAAWIATLWVNAVHGLNVAPWGGSGRRLGTNPHAIGIPGAAGPAMVLDFATSVVAEGKMRVKKNRKQQAPLGWFIDAEGRPATDPEIFYGDPVGSLL